jgi:hypothetical protein
VIEENGRTSSQLVLDETNSWTFANDMCQQH